MKFATFFEQLRKRRVYRVVVFYAAGVWVFLQVADVVLESFDGGEMWMQGLILLSVIGLPLVLLANWLLGSAADQATVDAEDNSNSQSAETAGEHPRLLVLPFEPCSSRDSDRWYARALGDDIGDLLARSPGYSVISRNTANAYRDQPLDSRAIAADLGVRYLLEGSVRHVADALRVDCRLIEAQTGVQLWSEQIDRREEEVEQLHDETCRTIALRLGLQLTRAEVALTRRTPPAEWGAWELYQQAKGELQFSGWSVSSFNKTAELLRQAIALDPEFAPAHAYLSVILALGHWIRMVPDRNSAYQASLAAADKALALAPNSSEVLGYVGCALSDLGHPERGVPVIDRAIELNPSNAQAVAALGAAKIVSGNIPEGIDDLSQAIDISPADPGLAPWSTMLSMAESFSGNTESGLGWADRARKADPRYYGAFIALAFAYYRLDRLGEAQAALDEAAHLNPDLAADSLAVFVGQHGSASMAGAGLRLPGG